MTTRRKFISTVAVGSVGFLAGCTSSPDSLAENGYELRLLDSIDNATYIDSMELKDVVRKEGIFGGSVRLIIFIQFRMDRGATPDPDSITLRQEDVRSGAYIDSFSWEDGVSSVELGGSINGGPVSRFSIEITQATSGISEQTLEEVDFEVIESRL